MAIEKGAAQSLNARGVKGLVQSFGVQGVRVPLQLVSQIVLARLLLPDDFGLIAMAVPMLTLVQTVGELGLAQAVIQHPELRQAEASGLYWLAVFVNLGLSIAVVATAPWVAWAYDQPRLIPILEVLAGLPIVNAVAAQQMAMLARRMQFGRMAIVDLSCFGVSAAVGIGCALEGMGVWSLVAMQAGNLIVIAALASWLSGWRPSWPRWTGGLGAMLGYGANLTGFNLVNYAGSNLDSVLIGAVAGSGSLGLYDRSIRLIVTPLWQLSMPLTRVATGLLSRHLDDPAGYRRAFLVMLQGLLLVTAPGLACGALLAEWLVPAVLGTQWAGAAPVVAWLCVAAMLMPFGIGASWLFVTQRRARAQLHWACLRTLLSLAGVAAGLPWGAPGIAGASAVMAPLVQGTLLWGATRQGAVGMRDVAVATLPILAATAAGVAAAWGSAEWWRLTGPAWQLLQALAVTYGVGLPALLCFPAGVALVRTVLTAPGLYRRGY